MGLPRRVGRRGTGTNSGTNGTGGVTMGLVGLGELDGMDTN